MKSLYIILILLFLPTLATANPSEEKCIQRNIRSANNDLLATQILTLCKMQSGEDEDLMQLAQCFLQNAGDIHLNPLGRYYFITCTILVVPGEDWSELGVDFRASQISKVRAYGRCTTKELRGIRTDKGVKIMKAHCANQHPEGEVDFMDIYSKIDIDFESPKFSEIFPK